MKTYDMKAEIFSIGTYHGEKYTEAHIDDMVANFTALSNEIKPPLKLGHESSVNKGQPALGWVASLKREGTKLIAEFKGIPEIVFNAIKGNRYKRVSSEIYWNFKSNDKIHSRVLSAVALLGADIPEVKTLADLQAFLAETPAEGSFEKVITCTADIDDDGKINNRRGDNMDLQAQFNELSKKFGELQTSTAIKDAEITKHKETADKAIAKLSEVQAENIKIAQATSAEAFKTFCEDMVKAGKMTPASRDEIAKGFDTGIHKYDETGYAVSFDTFKAVFEAQETLVSFKEKTNAGNGDNREFKSASDELNAKAVDYSAEKKVTYGEAIDHMLKTDTELAERYMTESSGGTN